MTLAAKAGGPTLPQRRELVTALPGPQSQQLARRQQSAVARGVSSLMPVYAARAGGGVLVDLDGNSFIDLGSGIATTTVGNSAPAVVEHIQRQAERFIHTCFMITPYPGYIEVCEELNALTPGDHEKRSALFNSGAEAVENAVKIARTYTHRHAVVAFDHGYHGRTNLTMALTAKNMPYKDGFGPFAGEIYRAPTSYPFREPVPTDGPAAAQRAIDMIERQIGGRNVAAIIIEPIHGEGGFVVPAPGFLAALAAWCRDAGVVFVADEIQTGFARTGTWFACEHENIVPDLITTAKGIAGGMPLAGVTGRAQIMDAVHAGGLGGTFGGNPVACAAALGVLQEIKEHGLLERAQQIGQLVAARLRLLQRDQPIVGDVRGRGAMMALEIVRPGGLEPDAAAATQIAQTCHARGVVTLTCGSFGNVLRLLPPLSISDDLLEQGLDTLGEAVQQVAATRP